MTTAPSSKRHQKKQRPEVLSLTCAFSYRRTSQEYPPIELLKAPLRPASALHAALQPLRLPFTEVMIVVFVCLNFLLLRLRFC